jgi:NAD(P)-dependent dehydrogenase (short-subunit alcohol dehydrogenase family)
MRLDLNGRRVLVTGASSGLGRRMAAMLAENGARVAAAARRRDALEALAAAHEGVTPIAMDVADSASVARGVAMAQDALGGLDGVIANAGIAWSGRAVEMPMEEWRRTMAVNLDGVFETAQAAGRAMLAQGSGSVIVIASILGSATGRGVAAYAASKAAAAHLTRSLAAEWGPKGVRVNALAPGYIPTEMNSDRLNGPDGEALAARIPLRRLGRPEDLDGAVAFLLSDASAWVTGAVIPVDGGHLVAPLS